MGSLVSRRRFLKLAGAAGVVALPGLLGYDLYRAAAGEAPPQISPYAATDLMPRWPEVAGGAAPLLVLIGEGAGNAFGAYLAEILRAEGLHCFQVGRVADLATAPLPWYDTVILAETALSPPQAEILGQYVASGSSLVAMRPDAALGGVLGVRSGDSALPEGRLQVIAAHPVARGIPTSALQFHGAANLYALDGAEPIAWLRGGQGEADGHPAVTLHRQGQGQAALWAYDLARSIVTMRQGNPEWANQERDGGLGIRAADMFRGWVDLDLLPIPQADAQQRLFANLLNALSQARRPLPRLWYFPGRAPSVLIATGDAHGAPTAAIASVVERVERRGGRATIYYSPPLEERARRTASRARFLVTGLPVVGDDLAKRFRSVDPRQIADWRARGHEFTLHPYVGQEGICAWYLGGELATPSLEEGWRRYWREFTGLGYGPVSPTTRTHCVLWTGWVESARLQASYGLRMNLDYYHWGPAFRRDGGEWVFGHLAGSGLPMRFMDEAGRLLAIYQQPTQLADDHLLAARFAGQPWGLAGYDADAAIEASRRLLRSAAQDHTAVAGNFHPDLYAVGAEAADAGTARRAARWLEGTLDSAAELGMPIWCAQDWLAYTEQRAGTQVDVVAWDAATGTLAARTRSTVAASRSVTLLVPFHHGGRTVAVVEADGRAVAFAPLTVAGVEYAALAAGASSSEVVVHYV